MGIVLFCNPNAAYYETISQHEFDKSWLGYYINLGYDVFFYNYRGYGRSEGSPTPSALKGDGQAVVEFIRKEFPQYQQQIIVHGESIGGMVACSIAANPSNHIAALICDRTFASLDATASRLMGNWAGNFMRFGAFWSTNVVNDYLAATCPKLVLQDPADEIIHEPASLKAGIAYKFCFNDNFFKVPSPPTNDYPVAYYLKEDYVPNRNKAKQYLTDIQQSSNPLQLTPEFVLHFYYCYLRIAHLSTMDYYHSVNSGLGSNSNDNNTSNTSNNANNNSSTAIATNGSSNLLKPLSQIEMIQRKGGLAASSSSSGPLTDDVISERPDPDNNIIRNGDSNNTSKKGSKDEAEASNPGSNNNNSNNSNSSNPPLRKAKLEDLLSVQMTDTTYEHKTLLPYKKAYIALFRLSNGCDYLLGHAMNHSLDHLQSWICTGMVWNGVNVKQSSQLTVLPPMTPMAGRPGTPGNRSSKEVNKYYRKGFSEAIQDLQELMIDLYPDSLGKNEELQFLSQALQILWEKSQRFRNQVNDSRTTTNITVMTPTKWLPARDDADHDLEALTAASPLIHNTSHISNSNSHGSHSPTSISDSTTLCQRCPQCFAATTGASTSCAAIGCSASTSYRPSQFPRNHHYHILASYNQQLTASQMKALLGDLLPLHTGHNGWLHSYELKYMTEWFEKHQLLPPPSPREG